MFRKILTAAALAAVMAVLPATVGGAAPPSGEPVPLSPPENGPGRLVSAGAYLTEQQCGGAAAQGLQEGRWVDYQCQPNIANTWRIVGLLPSTPLWYFHAAHSFKCADVSGASLEDFANVHQWTCVNGVNQRWRVTPLGLGSNFGYRITAEHSGKCLEVADASLADGAQVRQATCTGAANQQWSFSVPDFNAGYYKLFNRQSGRVLEVSNSLLNDGARVQQWTNVAPAVNQRWFLSRA
jgi:Ricin-type beta-trefoil lectin domain-like